MQDTQPGSQTRKLTRGRERMLGGVAAGLADYFDLDPTVVRLVVVLTALISGGVIVIAYIVLWIIMPEASSASISSDGGAAPATAAGERRGDAGVMLGMILLAIGSLLLLDQVTIFHWFGWHMARFWWPSLLIIGGIALILARRNRD